MNKRSKLVLWAIFSPFFSCICIFYEKNFLLVKIPNSLPSCWQCWLNWRLFSALESWIMHPYLVFYVYIQFSHLFWFLGMTKFRTLFFFFYTGGLQFMEFLEIAASSHWCLKVSMNTYSSVLTVLKWRALASFYRIIQVCPNSTF